MRARTKRARGFTAIEVMTAMTIFAIGAAGVLGMMQATVQSGLESRRMDIATGVADLWVERLRMDGLRWGPSLSGDGGAPTPAGLAQTLWLFNTGDDTSDFFTPQVPALITNVSASAAFDNLGRELFGSDTNTDTVFCTQLRLVTVEQDPLTTQPLTIRAEIRVYWRRDFDVIAPAACIGGGPVTGNGPTVPPTLIPAPDTYHSLNLVQIIRQNPA